MQTCSNCYAQSPDSARHCVRCGVDLSEFSTVAVALKRYQENPRVKMIRVSVSGNACPVCYELQGAYAKDQVPHLPEEGCSYPYGCRCFYEPILDELYP